ncbi:uroporphyrinogen-III decarboxylase [Desulfosporosinus orientis DSM 765]|uniref:Uroporphyrinogen-III decarboxylase n=1 Tax=Desulfosporosinus orientis (strain ATCC 19365 / DSM 765 / NCIMB 8382 / VKM B-1628 / Singapore I) TaxID=768706 RepID=G7WD12_DESOD|nr:uroporphyrinogen decarboxylase family protein [Desulfosporosinus orientis]AET67207.1 uroporphyrinogen-III decarboxylase [Desulfosporosinus orientis DSM 765]
MHEQDQMTPNERLQAFMKGEKMDRLLAIPVLVSISHRVSGITHREKRDSAEKQAQSQIDCYKRYGNDMMIIEYGLHGIGTALGTEVNDPEDSLPAVVHHVLEDLNDIDKLDFSKTKKENDPWLAKTLKACEICQERMGHEVPTGVLIAGPFTAVSSIYPTELLLRATRKRPEDIHRLMRLCTDALKDIYKEYIERGVVILMCDPIASGTLLRKSQYVDFVKPYATELMEYIHNLGGMCCYHICGNTTNIVEEMVDTGPDMLSIDNLVDLEYVKEKVGQRLPILGNVPPVDVLMLGSKEDVFQAVKTCIRKGKDSPMGYIVASGCDVTQNVPVENIDYMMAAVRKYGRYPLDEALLNE